MGLRFLIERSVNRSDTKNGKGISKSVTHKQEHLDEELANKVMKHLLISLLKKT